ncbi:MAG: membrane protein insertion efficiency factor YidD [Bacillota bacterium]
MKSLVVGAIGLYRRFLSPIRRPSCRFYPSCSQYALESVEKHGIRRGLGLSAMRLLKCGPWNPGGYDPVP